jgi:hypothetical protein
VPALTRARWELPANRLIGKPLGFAAVLPRLYFVGACALAEPWRQIGYCHRAESTDDPVWVPLLLQIRISFLFVCQLITGIGALVTAKYSPFTYPPRHRSFILPFVVHPIFSKHKHARSESAT